jgi:hypothetical protein
MPKSFSQTGRPKVVKPVLIQIATSPDFLRRFLKNGRKISPTFSRPGPEKGGEAGKSGVAAQKKIVTTHTGFTPFTTFFPVALKNCQLLAALPLV